MPFSNFLVNEVVNFISLNISRHESLISCKNSIHYKLKMPSLESTSNFMWVGWEKNERNKMGPRLANMKDSLDPTVISENSVNLNLKLMKWSNLPEIDLEKLKKTKCILLGSGTLGCSVARTLLGWGVRHITFVDNSTVSFSNPVRQSLFTHQDSVEMKPKSQAAAENLSKIFPGVNSKGFQITIPMPGHTVGDSMVESTIGSVQKLSELIADHDVIFLLTDSRESRWLPTLLGSAQQKIVINAALGFDAYLVMRHGIHIENGYQQDIPHPNGFLAINGADLGCYFCNDVTVPGNSMKNRTLDQQCTVTRPGVSQIAGALAVELAVSILQHKEGLYAPAFYSTSPKSKIEDLEGANSSILGLVPHTIRGFLSPVNQIIPATPKYKNCVACSEMIIKEYKTKGIDFLLKVFDSSKHLEEISLMPDMFLENKFGDVLEFSEDEDFDD
nr:ubiquitin-like modifier-activating enzyme ATG7 [Leptinotarsa decemlineata]